MSDHVITVSCEIFLVLIAIDPPVDEVIRVVTFTRSLLRPCHQCRAVRSNVSNSASVNQWILAQFPIVSLALIGTDFIAEYRNCRKRIRSKTESPSVLTPPDDRASALRYLGRSREARPLQIAPEFAHASVEVVGS
jgi:hypothetical protein